MDNNNTIDKITGTITLSDGTTSEFLLQYSGWSQWGAPTSRLGETVEPLQTATIALADFLTTD